MTAAQNRGTMLSRKDFAFLFLLGLYITYAIATDISAIIDHYSIVPFGDYEQVVWRFDRLKLGELSTTKFIFKRQADHPHALVFALSLVDLWVFDGSLIPHLVATVVFNIIVSVIFLYIIWKTELTNISKAVVSLLAINQVFSLVGSETWLLPFQVTLTGSRAFAVAGLLLLALSLARSNSSSTLAVAGTVLMSIAVISHGSGQFLILVTLAMVLISRRWIALTVPIFLGALYAIYTRAYPSVGTLENGSLPNDILGNLWIIIEYTAFLLGHAFAWGLLGEQGDKFAGAIGIATALATTIAYCWRSSKQSPFELFLLSTMAFGGLSALSSVIVNVHYAELRGVTSYTPAYFVAERYYISTAMFWIGLIPLALLMFRQSIEPLAIAPIIVLSIYGSHLLGIRTMGGSGHSKDSTGARRGGDKCQSI